MKRIILFIFALSFCFSNAQTTMTVTNPVNPKWFLGADMGATWQQSDLKDYAGIGFGFNFGKYIYKKPNRFLNFAWRFRYLHGVMYGTATDRLSGEGFRKTFDEFSADDKIKLSYLDTLGYMYPNYRMEINRYALEAMIGFNRLRERTGIVLNLFGGIGLTQHYNKTDHLDDFDSPLAYNTLDSTGVTLEDLENLGFRSFSMRRWDFESNTPGYTDGGKTYFMPSLGFELGYQFGNYFAMGVGHKVTFALQDGIDGIKYKNDGSPTGDNDRYHYSNFYLRFFLGRGNGHVNTHTNNNTNNNNNTVNTNTNTNTTTNTNVNNVPQNRPVIAFTSPSACPSTISSASYVVRANIYYISHSNQITFKVNGTVVPGFTYSATTHQFVSSPITLLPGDNIIEIKAYNQAGSDYQSCVVNYFTTINTNPTTLYPPVITINNPPTNPYNTNSSTITLTSTVLNVTSASQIAMQVNGVSTSAFFFNPANGALSSNIYLNPGVNTVNITATNAVGSDNESVTINYQQPVTIQPPIVTIYNPTVNPYTVSTNTATVNATVLNVASAANINVKVNGANYTGFTFNATTQQLSLTTSLVVGPNVVEITGTNAAGSDSKNTTIIYQVPVVNLPPVVTFTDPSVNPYSVTTSTKLVKAKVLNVSTASQVSVKLNGTNVPGFSFIGSTNTVSFTASLIAGANVVEIKGTNPYGTDTKSTVIIYNSSSTTGLPPVVAINYPLSNPFNTTNSTETVTATVLNVASTSGIGVKINGVATSSFTFNPTTHLVNVPVTLNTGSNSIAITGTNTYGNDSETQIINYTPPCNSPVLHMVNPAATSLTTTSGTLNFIALASNITSSSQITFKLNGANAPFTFDPASGSINATLSLTNGVNTIIVTATNSCGNASNTYTVTYNRPIVPPVVTYINPPTNPYSVTNASFNLSATILNMTSSAGIVYTVNGTPSTSFAFNPTTTAFTSTLSLIPGNNVVEIKATNADGTDVESTIIIYAPTPPPCNNPVIALLNPGGSTYATSTGVLNLLANVTNCTASQVNVSLNGTVVPSTLTGTNLSSNLTLNEGLNTIVINATNSCGSVTQSVVVTYTRIPEPPVVTITNPASNPYTTSTASLTINAKIYKVSSAANVTFTINGVASTAFTFNPTTNDFSANYTLTNPVTTFVIKGTNADGSDSKTLVVNYLDATPSCDKPVITYTSTIPTGGTTSSSSFVLAADVLNVSASTAITVKQNSLNIPFTFNPTTKKLSANATLISGLNEFIVTATNPCGTVDETYLITYNPPCIAPTIGLSSSMATSVTSSAFTFTANTTALTSSQITLTNNGVTVPFTLSTSGVVTASVTLHAGSNNLVITGTNACGSVIKNINVVYTAPCPAPTLTLGSGLPTSVTSASYNFTANSSNLTSSEITLTHNGTNVPFTLSSSGAISATITLTTGPNALVIIGSNACGYVTKNITVNYTIPCVTPAITITPSLPTSVSSASYTFTASTTGLTASQIELTNNGTVVPFTMDASGLVTANLTFTLPVNNFVITGTNSCGTALQKLSVTYTVPCIAPTLTVTSGLPTSATSATFYYTANSAELTASEITLKHNGSDVPFTFGTLGQINATITLTSGTNTIVVSGTNACGSSSKTHSVSYTPPCPTPSITLGSSLPTSVTSATYTFTATSAALTSAEIAVTNNGATVPFTLSAGGAVSATVTLVPGMNNIVITGSNTCGSVTKDIHVTYTLPCTPPTLNITPGLPASVSVTSYTFSATCTDLTASQINLTFNGVNIPFTLNASGGITASVTLTSGSNGFVLTGTSACGTVGKNFNVIYTPPCPAPSISLGTGLPTSATSASYAFTANTDELTASQVTLTNNGVAVPFTMNAGGLVSASLTLNAGTNNIVITGTSPCGSVTKSIAVNFTPPCPAPTITLGTGLATSSSSSSYTFTASSDELTASQVSLTNNGVNVPFTMNATGGITATITLNDGSNNIVIVGTTTCGSVTKNITVNYTAPCPTPTLTLGSSLLTSVTTPSYTFTANSSDLTSSQISLTNNGTSVPFTMNASGTVTANLTLSLGSNVIVITGTSTCGTVSKTINVIYALPCVTPIVAPTAGLPTNVSSDTYTYSASTSSLTSAQVTLTNNGNPVPFTMNASGLVTATLTLVTGNNSIEIQGLNSCGKDIKNILVVYSGPCEEPEIKLGGTLPPGMSTSTTTSVTSSPYSFSAITSGLTASQITLTNNGVNVPFTMSASGNVAASINLTSGTNTIVISGTNACGTATRTVTLNYTLPCTSPTINLASGLPTSVTNSAYTLNATTTELTSSQINVTSNGNPIPFTLNSSGVLTASLTLTVGTNAIAIVGNNDCGNATKGINVIYSAPCTTPVLNSIAPSINGATFTNSSLAVSGSFTGVNSASEITMKLNGTTVSGLYFNPTTGAFNKTLTLASGSNTITIDVANSCGTISESYTCTYTPPAAACGPRFNPGSSADQFCLITPTGTYTRDDLAASSSFTYSGPATSAYFKPIAGGGDAIVAGSPYPVINGNYYLFTGTLTVSVSTTHPGSMGHWTICITSDNAPVYGNGSSRPESPCGGDKSHGSGEDDDDKDKDKDKDKDEDKNKSQDNKNNGFNNSINKTINNNNNNNTNNNTNTNTQTVTPKDGANLLEYKKAMNKGNQLFMAKNYAGAKAEYQKALGLKPGDATATSKIKECEDAIKAAEKPAEKPKEVDKTTPEKKIDLNKQTNGGTNMPRKPR